MRTGLYKLKFQTPFGESVAMAVLTDGKIRGGDTGLFYLGTYQESGDKFSADVVTARHTYHGDIQSVFGTDIVHITLKGQFSGDDGQMTGTSEEMPGLNI